MVWGRKLLNNMYGSINTICNPRPFREWPPLHLHPPAHAGILIDNTNQAGELAMMFSAATLDIQSPLVGYQIALHVCRSQQI